MIVKTEDIDKSKYSKIDVEFEDTPEGIDLVEPARADIHIERVSPGFIKAEGKISAKIKAKCDNCLKEFILNLDTTISEIYAETTLYEEYKSETEIKDNFFAIDLNGSGEIDLTDLMYQSLILAIPNKLVCDIKCIGLEETSKYIKKGNQDPRLEVFKTIKTEKDE